MTGTDPAAGAEAARTAAGHLRRAGARDSLAIAIGNLAQALLMLGDWDTAEPSSPRPPTPTAWPSRSTSPATGAGWRRCAATPPPPRPCWRDCATCGPAKIRRTRQ